MAGLLGPGPPGPRRLARPHRSGTGAGPPTTSRLTMPSGREEREELEDALLRPRGHPADGRRRPAARPSQPDEWRTCFERDRDRILHATSFRRLAGKTQVFVFPQDHQRTRLTHALEVAQVATAIARGLPSQRGPHRGHRAGSRLRSRARRPRQRGRAGPLCAGGFRPRRLGGATCPSRRSTCVPRPSTASRTTAGRGPRRRPPKARWSAGPTGSPTSATTGRTPCWPASSLRTSCPPRSGPCAANGAAPQLGAFIRGSSRPPCAPGRSAWRRRRPRHWPPSGRATTSGSTCRDASVAPGRSRGQRAAGPGGALLGPAPPHHRSHHVGASRGRGRRQP